jgi:hypothetical protein
MRFIHKSEVERVKVNSIEKQKIDFEPLNTKTLYFPKFKA